MKAIEFITKQKNGTIEIPKKYLNSLKKDQFRVIILINAEQEAQKTTEGKKPLFKALQIKTKGFKFDREDANKR